MPRRRTEPKILYSKRYYRKRMQRIKELARKHSPQEVCEMEGICQKTFYNAIKAPLSLPEQKEIRNVRQDNNSKEKNPLHIPVKISKIKKDADITEFTESEEFLGSPDFPMQRLIKKCLYGLELNEEERIIINRLIKEKKTTYDGRKRYTELVCVIGMKGGKTKMAGDINCYEEYELFKMEDFREHYGLQKGKEVYIKNVAVNAIQAEKTIFAEVKARIENSKYYRLHAPISDTAKRFVFPNGVVIESGHSNSSSLVGDLSKLVELDELARFIDKGGKYSADKVYYALIRGVTPFKEDGKIVSISSPMFAGDMITELYKKSEEIDKMLGFWLPTWEMNPHLPFKCELLQRELKKNPEAFWRDYGAQPSLSQEAYYRIPEKVDKVIGKNLKHHARLVDANGRLIPSLKGNPRYDYYVHADPSAKNDAYGLAMAHLEGERPVVDLAYRFLPHGGEIDLNEVEHFIEQLTLNFNVKQFSYDTWQATAIAQMLKRRSVECLNLFVDKSVHDRLKEYIYNDNIELPPIEILGKELKGLVLLNGKKVDHTRSGTKDVADSVAGAVWFCLENPVVEIASGGKDWDSSEYRQLGLRR